MNIAVEQVQRQVVEILSAWGMPEDLVETTADAIVYADVVGVDSHGLSMLMLYEDVWKAGRMRVEARPKIVRETATTALVDAAAGFGHPAGVLAMQLAIDKASSGGIGAVTVFNSHHFGAAGYYAALAPERGLIGFVTTSTRSPQVLPTRAAMPALGTNPIAFAAPARRNRPFLLDMSTSTVAANKVKVYDFHQKRLPPGWVLDEHGQSVTDPALAMEYVFKRDVGGITALGGTAEMGSHKGYGLSAMVQILSAALSGGSFPAVSLKTQKASDPENVGHFCLAIDPKAFRPEGGFEDDVDALIDVLHQTPPTNPAMPVLVPGDPEAMTREQRLRDGIPIPQTLSNKIRAICERCGAPFLFV